MTDPSLQPDPQPFPNPLRDLHDAAGAEFQPYERLEIVGTFGEPQAEYAALRKGCGLMDEPQRGVLELTGRDRLPFLNNLLTGQTWDKERKAGMAAGTGVYAYFLNLKGRVVADMNVIELGDRTLLETDVRLVEPLRDVFDKYLFGEQVKMMSRVGALHRLTLHGPRAAEVLLEASGGSDVSALPPLGSMDLRVSDSPAVVFRDDVAGSPGFHLVVDSSRAREIWSSLMTRFGETPEAGRRRRVWPVGWAAFNACRIEAGRPLFGVDFEGVPAASAYPARKQREDEAAEEAAAPGVLPAETGQLKRAVSFTKGCYLGQEIVARMYARGQVAKQIVGLRLDDDALPIAGAPVLDEASNVVGVVTSSTVSPLLSNKAICLGYVRKPLMKAGSIARVPAEGSVRTATVVELPFVPFDAKPQAAGQAPAPGV